MIRSLAVAICAIAVLTLNARAEGEIKPQFKADDVLGHFKQVEVAPKINCPAGSVCLPKKKSRGVCIGGSSDCGPKPRTEVRSKGGFDLLITFELGSDQLSAVAMANLKEFAKALNADGLMGQGFNVDGHTDARGADSLNSALSERRAKVVVDFLVSLGVDENRLHAQGFGESRPRIKDDPFAGANRRVEATLRTN